MADAEIAVDYLVIGAGAVGMAIADTLISESEASVAIVDRMHRPGGHWNESYPFVRLHGPSANYGVNSKHLGSDRIDQVGLNQGLYELASGSEICTYFDEVMRENLLPTGRLHYLPMNDCDGEGVATSLISGQQTHIIVRKKTVDATVSKTEIPATTPPKFKVDPQVTCIPPNDLVKLGAASSSYVVIGAGKTAIDTVTWLLDNGSDPEAITWVRPRDAWLLNRGNVQPTYEFFDATYTWLTANMEAAAKAETVDDIFLHLEAEGCMHRIDRSVMPTMYRCAIVSGQELEQLRRVTNVVRLGHVQELRPAEMLLEGGTVSVAPDTVFVNCSADGIPRKKLGPIFQGETIVPQYVRTCSPTFSGALVAKVELLLDNDEEKNRLTLPTPIPDEPADWVDIELNGAANTLAWMRNEALMTWLLGSRLDQFSKMTFQAAADGDQAKMQLLERYRKAIKPAVARMREMAAAQAA